MRLWLAAGHEHLRQVCNVQVKLCDLASGAFTHSLVGHKEAVWALHWSLTSEWHLFTSAADGQVRRSQVLGCSPGWFPATRLVALDVCIMVQCPPAEGLSHMPYIRLTKPSGWCRSDCGIFAPRAVYMCLISMTPMQQATADETGKLFVLSAHLL